MSSSVRPARHLPERIVRAGSGAERQTFANEVAVFEFRATAASRRPCCLESRSGRRHQPAVSGAPTSARAPRGRSRDADASSRGRPRPAAGRSRSTSRRRSSSRYFDAVSWRRLSAGNAVERQDDAEVDARVGDVAGRRAARRSARPRCAGSAGPARCTQSTARPGVRDRVVRHAHDQAHVARLVHRPLRERAVAEVVADEHVLGDAAASGGRPGPVNRSHAASPPPIHATTPSMSCTS